MTLNFTRHGAFVAPPGITSVKVEAWVASNGGAPWQ